LKQRIKLLVALGFLALLLWKSDGLGSLWEVTSRLTLSAAFVAIAGFTLDRLLMAYKWIRLLRVRGSRLGLLLGTRIYCASMVWGLFLPATVGADAIRTLCTRRAGIPTGDVVATILIERVVGIAATAMLALAGLVLLWLLGDLDPRLAPAWWAGCAALLGASLGFGVSLDDRLFCFLRDRVFGRFARLKPVRMLVEFHATYREFGSARAELLRFTALTLAEQAFPIAIFWALARGMGLEVGFFHMAAAVPLAFMVSRLPLSIGGLGVFEAVFVLVLSAGGLSIQAALSVALVARVLEIAAWLPWWLRYTMGAGSLEAIRARGQAGSPG